MLNAPLKLDWGDLRDDAPPPELEVVAAAAGRGGGEAVAQDEGGMLAELSDHQIREKILRLAKHFSSGLASSLPDKGVKLRENLLQLQGELERRNNVRYKEDSGECERARQSRTSESFVSRNVPSEGYTVSEPRPQSSFSLSFSKKFEGKADAAFNEELRCLSRDKIKSSGRNGEHMNERRHQNGMSLQANRMSTRQSPFRCASNFANKDTQRFTNGCSRVIGSPSTSQVGRSFSRHSPKRKCASENRNPMHLRSKKGCFKEDVSLLRMGHSKFAKLEEGKESEKIVTDTSFWRKMEQIHKTVLPIILVLKAVDGEKPVMGEIYDLIDKAKMEIAEAHNNNERSYKKYWDIIDERWDSTLHSPLHAAGYFLNPHIHYRPDVSNNPEIRRGLQQAIAVLEPDIDVQIEAIQQVQHVVLLDEEDVQPIQPIHADTPDDLKEAKIYYPSRDDPESVELSYSDIKCLDPESFLSSPIMNFYIRYLQRPVSPIGRLRSEYYFFNTYFYRKLEEAMSPKGDRSAHFLKLRRWWKGVNIFKKAYIFLPIHGDLHWSLVIICIPAKEDESGPIVLHLDSLGHHTSNIVFDVVNSYLKQEWNYINQNDPPPDVPISESIWRNLSNTIEKKKLKVPQQKNIYDCGLFVLYFMERFIEEAPKRLRKNDIAKFGSKWFKPEDASGLRKRIRDLLEEEFARARLENGGAESPVSSSDNDTDRSDQTKRSKPHIHSRFWRT